MRYRKRKEHKFQHTANNLRLVTMSDEERKTLLQQHGSEAWALSPHIYHVEFSSLNRAFRGYGIKNNNGGVEFINTEYMDSPVTLRNNGFVSIYAKEGKTNKNCCLFFGFTDYLAFLAIQKTEFLNLPDGCDCFIMSHVLNLISMVIETDGYENIYMFFPNNDVGITIAKTIEQRNRSHVHNCSILYSAKETLQDFATEYVESLTK